MNKEFVPYEESLELKELGFDEECLAYYTTGNPVTLDKEGNKTNFVLLSAKRSGELVGHGTVRNFLFKWLKDNDRTYGELSTLSNSVTAPLYRQVFRWFREKHGLHSFITGDLITYDIEIWDTRKHLEIHKFISSLTKEAGEFTNKDGKHYLFGTYEEAELECIKKLIEICSLQKK